MTRRFQYTILMAVLALTGAAAQKRELIKYGDFEQWVTRNVHESAIIGGNDRQVYEVGPTATIEGSSPYKATGGSPWATSNVVAKVCGVTKCSNAVFPDDRPGGGRCARLTSLIEHCKAAGIINIDVMVAGTMFLGHMIEPIKSTSDPYSKMEMGVPFTRRPKALCYDYRLLIPAGARRIYSSGFGRKKDLPGSDKAEVFIILQRRWEDSDGHLYAKRVGTGRELLAKTTPGWVNAHRLHVHYGDITSQPYYCSSMQLIPAEKIYYARNSRGKMVPVEEVGWDSADSTPTHIIVMFSAGSGEPYTGTPGQTLWIDNVALLY